MTAASILIVEDEVVTARDLQLLLEDLDYVVPVIATTASEALQQLATRKFDLVLLDIHLADGSDGIYVAQEILVRWALPVIFLTAHADPATVQRAQTTAPYGYLLKPFHEREVAVTVQLALTKSRGDQQLRASEQLFSTTLRSLAEGVMVTDEHGRIVYLNPAAETLTGWGQHEAFGEPLGTVLALHTSVGALPMHELVTEVMTTLTPITLPDTTVLITRAGTVYQVANTIAPIIDERGTIGGTVVVFQDVTAQRAAAAAQQRLERKLLETQRLESLGLLAGGIAHDFNNFLTAILAYTQMAQELLPAEAPAQEKLARAVAGVYQATELTTQLLAYAGKGQRQPSPVALNRIIREVLALLHGSLMRQIEFDLVLEEDLPLLMGDGTQLRQMVLNLLTNAAEALAMNTGQISVTTNHMPEPPDLGPWLHFGDGATPGPSVVLSVHDTGKGMDQETLARIFDPFFTTKVTGHGLGLAAVLGIVRRHRGALHVTSTPGAGTLFQVLLPLSGPTDGVGKLLG